MVAAARRGRVPYSRILAGMYDHGCPSSSQLLEVGWGQALLTARAATLLTLLAAADCLLVAD